MRYRTTIDSRARDTQARWKHNAKLRTCVCGGEKETHVPFCTRCWFRCPENMRNSFLAAKGAEKHFAAREIAAWLNKTEANKVGQASSLSGGRQDACPTKHIESTSPSGRAQAL